MLNTFHYLYSHFYRAYSLNFGRTTQTWEWNKTLSSWQFFYPGSGGHADISTGGADQSAVYIQGLFEFNNNVFTYERFPLNPNTFGPSSNSECSEGVAPNCRVMWGSDPIQYEYKNTAYSFFPYRKSFIWRDVEKVTGKIRQVTSSDFVTDSNIIDCGFAMGFGENGPNPVAPGLDIDLNLSGAGLFNDNLRFHYRLKNGEDSFLIEGDLNSNLGGGFSVVEVSNSDPDRQFNIVDGAGPRAHGEYIELDWEINIDHASEQVEFILTPISSSQNVSLMQQASYTWIYTKAFDNTTSGGEADKGLRFLNQGGSSTVDQWLDSQMSLGFIVVGSPLRCEFSDVVITYQGVPTNL